MTTRIKYVLTCGACPEQYDAFLDDDRIGYLRLRHGYFYAEYVPTSEIVYSTHPNGDGIFEHEERDQHLNAAAAALIARHQRTADHPTKLYYIDGESAEDWWKI